MNAPVVIIGTGLAGYNVAREFRKLISIMCTKAPRVAAWLVQKLGGSTPILRRKLMMAPA